MKASTVAELLGFACFVAAVTLATAAGTHNPLWTEAAGLGSACPSLLFIGYGTSDAQDARNAEGMLKIVGYFKGRSALHKARKAARKQARADRRTAKAPAAV